MKRILATLLLLVFLLPLIFAGAFSSYDFTFYQTADKSMMEFSKQVVGIDYTGYGYIGSSAMKGLYIRLGIQTPYDNLINALLELKAQALQRANNEGKAATVDEMEKSQEVVNSMENVLSQTGLGNVSTLFGSNTSNKESISSNFDTSTSGTTTVPTLPDSNTTTKPNLPDSAQPADSTFTPSTTPEDDISKPNTENNTLDSDAPEILEGNNSLMDIDDAEENVDTEVDKENTPRKEMDVNWTLSFTIGPAYRSFMGENALVYMGLGITNTTVLDYHFDDKTELSLTDLSNTVGVDIDFGIRFDVQNSTTMRIGTHVTTDLIGWNSIQQKNKENEVLYTAFNFYGYAFAGDSIFTNMENVWYVRLATTFKQRKHIVYDYVNPSSIIGGGYLIPRN